MQYGDLGEHLEPYVRPEAKVTKDDETDSLNSSFTMADDRRTAMLQVVKTWMKNDNEIRALQKQQQIRKAENNRLSIQLMEIMKENEIDCFEIKNGKIMYKKRTMKKAISKKMLLQVLSTYFRGDEQQAEALNHYIMDNREVVVKETVAFSCSKTKSTG